MTVFENMQVTPDFTVSQRIWDQIAKSFDTTRTYPWSIVTDFITTSEKPQLSADLGCGNGRHLIPLARKSTHAMGIDLSKNLLTITDKKLQQQQISNTTLIQASNTHLPITTSSIDLLIYIASLHNIKTNTLRIQSLREVKRILKPKGRGLISVWARDQPRFKEKLKQQKKDSTLEPGDIILYWRQHNHNIPRFYHLYQKNEFQSDISTSGLTIDHIQQVSLTTKTHIDNYFAYITK